MSDVLSNQTASAAPVVQARASWRDWYRFPASALPQNPKTERALVAMIWAAMPSILYLLMLYPGGYGSLILRHPEYFILSLIAVLVPVIAVYLVCFAITALTVRHSTYKDPDDVRARRKALRRAWITAVISCFAATTILLSLSTLAARTFLFVPGNATAIDFISRGISLLLNDDGRAQNAPWTWISGYVHALIAVFIVSVLVRTATRRAAAKAAWDSEMPEPAADASADPNFLAVAFAGYVILGLLYITVDPTVTQKLLAILRLAG